MSLYLPPQHPDSSLPSAPAESPFSVELLTPAQKTSLANLKAHFASPAFKVPLPTKQFSSSECIDLGYTEGLHELEEMWLSEECLLRFLRATKWNEKDATDRLSQTLLWRREFGVDQFTQEYISPENETGKQIVWGFDNQRRPIWYMRPGLQNTAESERQIAHVFYTMSLCEHLMPRGVEKLVLAINFAARGKSPSTSTSIKVLRILQDHYPERLGTAFVINVPWLVQAFFKMITPLLDPVTRSKLILPSTPSIAEHAPTSQLESSFGGSVTWPKYGPTEHAEYWFGPTGFVALAKERQRRGLENWRKLGGERIGRREWDWKQGEETWGVEAEAR
ncbi:Phosphatidylinositol transfer protein PDR16 and related proteins [Phaffia rhodozyma]|uniref:Phosphatidylinositol transfer protein PDR16 and related proteins n=1 Tax=Phaffia rhodozyma TaxID=264483 RepID=A0A0F7SXL7_PHARH|nr:Phosphatidylinositol transfer protein PDR16 and related proteins [Phaffia rhodozyma]